MKQHGDTVAGKKIEIIRKDVGGIAPDCRQAPGAGTGRARQGRHPRGLRAHARTRSRPATCRREAKKFMVIMNAATSIITTKSPYMARTSFTLPHAQRDARHLGRQEAASRRSTRWSPTTAPAIDAEGAFQSGFKDGGGEIVGSVRMPVANPDFSAFVQRAKDLNPEAIFVFVPGGAQPAALGKALAERGIDPKKIKVMGTGRTDRRAARSRAWATPRSASSPPAHYDYNHNSDDEPGVRQGLQRRLSSAIPTSSRSAAMTACT